MNSPLPGNTSGTARLLLGAPSYAVGWQEPVYLGNPPAGQGWTYTVGGRYYERVLSVSFTLATSAAVANRFGQLFLEDTNGTVITSVPMAGTIVASSNVNVNLQLRAPQYSNASSGGTFGFIPDLLIPPGWKWVLTVFGQDVADQVSGIVLLVQRYPNDTAAISAVG